ncbi:MAG: hypothetical protein LKE27_09890 [Atopobiaceae bacterium]|nr:hypothetical protein [Atopobiaceae bacterium]
MAGEYAVPQEIRAMKPKGTMVKKIPGGYYVYGYRSVRDPDGKRRTRMGRCIGKIDPALGFVPNSNPLADEEVTCLDFGEWAVAEANSHRTLALLREFFSPADAERIYAAALIHFVQGFTYMKDLARFLEMSVLSLRHPGLRMGHDAMSSLCEDLGRRQGQGPVLAMEQALVDRSSGLVAIDGRVVGSGSRENGLAAKGCRFARLGEPQMNLLMAFDAETGLPLLSRMYEGAALGRAGVAGLLAQARFEGVVFVAGRGFCSEENVGPLAGRGSRCVVPLSRGLSACREAVPGLGMGGRFVWQRGSEATAAGCKGQEASGRRVLTCRDMSEPAAEQASCLRHMERGDRAYTQERFDELAPLMGVTVLQTSLPASERDAEAVYGLCKRRRSVETYFDYFKNGQDARGLCQQDFHRVQGLAFAMLVSGLIHREVADAVAASGVGMSVGDVLMDARMVKAARRNGSWVAVNCKKKRVAMLDALHTSLEVAPKAV